MYFVTWDIKSTEFTTLSKAFPYNFLTLWDTFNLVSSIMQQERKSKKKIFGILHITSESTRFIDFLSEWTFFLCSYGMLFLTYRNLKGISLCTNIYSMRYQRVHLWHWDTSNVFIQTVTQNLNCFNKFK